MKLSDLRNLSEGGGPMYPSWDVPAGGPSMPGIPPITPIVPPNNPPKRPPNWTDPDEDSDDGDEFIPTPQPEPSPIYPKPAPRPVNAPEELPWWVNEPGQWGPIIPILGIPAALEAIRRSGGAVNPGLAY